MAYKVHSLQDRAIITSGGYTAPLNITEFRKEVEDVRATLAANILIQNFEHLEAGHEQDHACTIAQQMYDNFLKRGWLYKTPDISASISGDAK